MDDAPIEPDVALRLERLESTLLEVVTALGMLVGELALQDNLVLTKAAAVEDALEKGWDTLFGVTLDRSRLREGPGVARLSPEEAGGAVVIETDPALRAGVLGELARPAFAQALQDADAAVGALYEVVGGREVVLLESSGYPHGVMEQFARFPIGADLPVAAAARSGRPLWFDERRAILESYPDLKDAHEQTEAALGREAVQGAVIPVRIGSDGRLVLLFGFAIGDRRIATSRDLSQLGARFAQRLADAR